MLLLIAFFAVYMFIEPNILSSILNDISFEENPPNYLKQIFGLLFIVITSVSIYCLYIFRKTLRYFQKTKPFHNDVIENFYKIGYLLVGVGIGGTLMSFTSRLLFRGQLTINLGLTPYVILICLGLFFMVLSEVFKIAKHAKEENELTV